MEIEYLWVYLHTEEGLAVNPNYPCCSFRGSMLVLDKDCGKILWKTFTVPEGYSDGAVWSSTPVIDTKRNLVYVTTGNNYDVPDEVKECIRLKGLESAHKCMAEDNYIDAFIVFDMDTGEILWSCMSGGSVNLAPSIVDGTL